jgi:hypothetical protein
MFCIEVIDEKNLPMVIARAAGPWQSDVESYKTFSIGKEK